MIKIRRFLCRRIHRFSIMSSFCEQLLHYLFTNTKIAFEVGICSVRSQHYLSQYSILYGSGSQPLCRGTLVCRGMITGAPRRDCIRRYTPTYGSSSKEAPGATVPLTFTIIILYPVLNTGYVLYVNENFPYMIFIFLLFYCKKGL